MDTSVVLSGAAVGAGFGFVLQRGRFCLNTAFRNVFYIHEYTLVRAYLAALTVSLLGANLLILSGLLHPDHAHNEFPWLANVLGGYLFGIGMVLAGGDAGSTWSRAGEGLVGSWMAAIGFLLAAAAANTGCLSGLTRFLGGFALTLRPDATLPSLMGIHTWVLVPLAIAAYSAFLFFTRASYSAGQAGYRWSTAGILVGVMIVLGLVVSEVMTGTASGISFPSEATALLSSVVSSKPLDWGAAVLAGVPLGSFLSARGLREFAWRAPHAKVMVQQLAGGLLMGAGGVIAGGCGIGHGLTGLALLSVPSLVSTAFIVLGCWTMVYVLFMKNPGGR